MSKRRSLSESFRDWLIAPILEELHPILKRLKEIHKMSIAEAQALAAMEAAVARSTSAQDSATTLLIEIAGKLNADADNADKIRAFAAQLVDRADKLASAVTLGSAAENDHFPTETPPADTPPADTTTSTEPTEPTETTGDGDQPASPPAIPDDSGPVTGDGPAETTPPEVPVGDPNVPSTEPTPVDDSTAPADETQTPVTDETTPSAG